MWDVRGDTRRGLLEPCLGAAGGPAAELEGLGRRTKAGGCGWSLPPALPGSHAHTLMHTHTHMHTHIHAARFLPSAKYRSPRRGFKGSHGSPNRRVNILRRSPCYSPPPFPPLEACHSCDPRCPGQPKVRSQAHCSSTHTECLCQGRVLLRCRSTQLVHLGAAFSFELSHVAHEVTEVIPGDWVTV